MNTSADGHGPGDRRIERGVTFARRVFTGAAVYGILVLAPQYFMEGKVGRDFPPPITHPEHFYGFVGVALAWQFLFLLIASDPIKYRAAMLVAVLEKLAFGLPAIVLYAQGRLAAAILGAGLLDLLLAVLFVASYRATRTLGARARTRTQRDTGAPCRN